MLCQEEVDLAKQKSLTARIEVAKGPVDGLGVKILNLDNTGLCLLEATCKSLLEPRTAAAQDDLMQLPLPAPTLDSHIGKEFALEDPGTSHGERAGSSQSASLNTAS